MSVIILFNGHDEVMRPQTAARPWPLLEVAGSTLAGYSLLFLNEVLDDKIVIVLSGRNRPVAQHLRESYPDREFSFVHLEGETSHMAALVQCKDIVALDRPCYLINGDAIYKADYPAMAGAHDGTILLQDAARGPGHFGVAIDDEGRVQQLSEAAANGQAAVGAFWIRDTGRLLAAAVAGLSRNPHASLLDLWQTVLEDGATLGSARAAEWENGLSHEALLRMNSRLLANNFGRSNALERSFGEGFTVITPVYLADSAEIDGAVLGPYVSIGEDAFVKDAVLINCVISAGAHVEAVTLQDSLIGPGARVVGKRQRLFVGQDELVDLGN